MTNQSLSPSESANRSLPPTFAPAPFAEAVFKRALDILFTLPLFVVFTLTFPVVWFAIRLDTPGRALYTQSRIGRNGETFTILKYRSMHVDAEARGIQWAQREDPRVTRVGRILRSTRIDELPQCLNVLKGEMSLIGPRPERPEWTSVLQQELPNFNVRHAIRPGLTGLAQVKHTYTAELADWKTKLEYDLHYLENASIWMDLAILSRTVWVVCRGNDY